MSYGEFVEPLKCAECGAPFAGKDIDRSMGLATCASCGAVADLRARLKSLPPEDRPAPPRKQVPLPERFQVTEEPGTLRIEWRWFTPAVFALLFFCLFWDGFLVFWYAGALANGEVAMALFPVVHVAVGVGLTYTTLAKFVNRSVVEVARGSLKVSHGPLPWLGGGEHARDDLKQLYVEEKVSRGKNTTTVTYTLSAILSNGRKRALLSGLTEKEQGLYLERAIESRFGIVDEPVAGAVE